MHGCMLACVSRYVIDCVGMYAYTRQYNMHVHIYIYKYMLIYLCNCIQIRTLLKYRVDVQVRQTHVLLHAPIYLLFWIYFMCACVCTGTFLHWLTGVCIYIYKHTAYARRGHEVITDIHRAQARGPCRYSDLKCRCSECRVCSKG